MKMLEPFTQKKQKELNTGIKLKSLTHAEIAGLLNWLKNCSKQEFTRKFSQLIQVKNKEIFSRAIVRAQMDPKASMIVSLLKIAAYDRSGGFRKKFAYHSLDNFPNSLLTQTFTKRFYMSQEKVLQIILLKMGRNQLPGTFPILRRYYLSGISLKVKLWALESMGYSRDRRCIPFFLDSLKKGTSLEKYISLRGILGVLTDLEDYPELLDILYSTDPNEDYLKALLMKSLLYSYKWEFNSEKFSRFLGELVSSTHQTLKYLAIKLIGRSENKRFIGLLLFVFSESDQNSIRKEIIFSLNELVSGKLDLIAQEIFPEKENERFLLAVLEIFSKMDWNLKKFELSPKFWATLERIALRLNLVKYSQAWGVISARIAKDNPKLILDYFQVHKKKHIWRLCLASEWINVLKKQPFLKCKPFWEDLLYDMDPRIAKLAIETLGKDNRPESLFFLIKVYSESPPLKQFFHAQIKDKMVTKKVQNV